MLTMWHAQNGTKRIFI